MEKYKKIRSLYSELADLTRLALKELPETTLFEGIKNEDDDDKIWELPRTYDVGKYGTYTEYAITKIRKGDEGEIEIDAISLGDGDFGEYRIFGEYELDTLQIMEILNYIDLEMGTSPTN